MDLARFYEESLKLFFMNKRSYFNIRKQGNWIDALIGIYLICALSLLVNSITTFAYGLELSITEMILTLIFSLLTIFFVLVLESVVFYGLAHFFFMFFEGVGSFEETLRFGWSLQVFPFLVSLLFFFVPKPLWDTAALLSLDGSYGYLIFSAIIHLFILALAVWTFSVMIKVYSRLHEISMARVAFGLLLSLGIIILFGISVTALFFLLQLA